MKYKDNGQWKEIYIKALDSMPVGTEVDFDGQVSDIPVGWEQVDDPTVYSTTETKIGTWKNGKPLYRKIITGTVPSPSTADTIASASYDISSDMEFGFAENGYITDSNYSFARQIPTCQGAWNTTPVILSVNNSTKKLTIQNMGLTYYNGYPFEAIVCYTKTTDTGNGGNA